MSTTTEVITGG